MQKVMITGGMGFIGSNLVGPLLSEGYGVVAYDNLSTGHLDNIREFETSKNFQFVKGDILDYSSLLEEMKSVDYILHHAALPSVVGSVLDPLSTNKINVEGTLKVLAAAKETNVKKVVVASTTAVYGDSSELPKTEDMCCNPLSPYAVSKIANELYAELFSILYSLPTICLRYFNVYGPNQDQNGEYAAVIPKFIVSALEGKPLTICGDGSQTRDFIFVKDAVKANMLSIRSRIEGVFNVATGYSISIEDLAKKIIKLTHSSSEIIHVESRSGEIMHSRSDITKAKKSFGYEPSFTMNEGLLKTIEWFRSKLIK